VRGAEWVLFAQLTVTFVLGFALSTSFQGMWHESLTVRKHSRRAFIACIVAYVGAGVGTWVLEHQKLTEQRWVRARVEWMAPELRNLIARANTLKTDLLTAVTGPAGLPLATFQRVHEPGIGVWRDRAIAFLESELPCTGAGVPYNFGGGSDAIEWSGRILDGTVSQLSGALANLDSLVARSCVPRSAAPQRQLGEGQSLQRPRP
jgi:hypothetical protein